MTIGGTDGRQETHLSVRSFDAVSSRCGAAGFTLTAPIFCRLSAYAVAPPARASWRTSMCVSAPAASAAQSVRPSGARSTALISVPSGAAYTSREMPVEKDRCRIVQS